MKVTCTDSGAANTITDVTGDVGVLLATGFTNTGCTIEGTVYQGGPIARAAYIDFLTAYHDLQTHPPACDETLTGPLAGQVLLPGVYCVDAVAKTGTLTLDAQGEPNAVWIFLVSDGVGTGALTGTDFHVVMMNGGDPCNVYWSVEAAATMTASNFLGTILAGAAITANGGTFEGRALATADVTVTDATVSGCAAPGPPFNTPPVANRDAYSTDQNTVLNVPAPGVLANDTDADGDSLTAVQVTNARNGNVVLNADGSFTYTPNAGFYGADRFTYRANDGSADSNVATVRIKVRRVNCPPIARDDTYRTKKDKRLVVPAPGVLGNDTDPDNDALTAWLVRGPAHGTLTLDPNGSFVYMPNRHFTGRDTFTYQARDAVSTSNTATVTIKVTRTLKGKPNDDNDDGEDDDDRDDDDDEDEGKG